MEGIATHFDHGHRAGLAGIQRGMAKMGGAAQALAKDIDPAAIVDLELGRLQAEAGVEIVRTSDEMLGKLIETIA